MTTFPTPAPPEPTTYLKSSELVKADPPLSFELLRVGEGTTQYGDKFYVSVVGPADGDFTISWKQGDNQQRDELLTELVGKSSDKTLERGLRFSLYRTGPGGKVITLGPPLDGAVPFEQTTLAADESTTDAQAEGDDIPF